MGGRASLGVSERIKIVRAVSEQLSQDDWTDIELTLGQFGAPTPNEPTGGPYAHCVARIQQLDDHALLQLQEHVLGTGGDSSTPQPQAEPGPWKPDCFHLFLSHVSSEKVLLSEVKRRLALRGIDGFVAHEDIDPIKEWQDEIELALQTADALAALLTNGFHESKWTDQEIGFCMSRRILVIPVRLGVDPYGFIGRYQAVAPKNEPESIAAAMFAVLLKHELTRQRMAVALVSQFSASSSYKETQFNAKLIELIEEWTPELLRTIEQAVENNSQVSGAWGIREMVQAIVKAHGS